MGRGTKTRPWTRTDLERLPDDGNRCEVLDGELLVTPQASVIHQLIATKTAWADLRRDLGAKRDAFLGLGVPAYWVVDGESRQVTVCTPAVPNGVAVTEVIRWQPLVGIPAFEIRLDRLLPPGDSSRAG